MRALALEDGALRQGADREADRAQRSLGRRAEDEGAARRASASSAWANALIIDGAAVEDNFRLAARNIPDIDVLPVAGINVYDIMRRDTLVLTKAAVEALTERFK